MANKRCKVDSIAWEALRNWKPYPTPENMRMGQPIRHLPTGRWMTFGEFDGDSIIALHGDVPEVIQASECRRGWDPDVDPEEFAAILAVLKKEKHI